MKKIKPLYIVVFVIATVVLVCWLLTTILLMIISDEMLYESFNKSEFVVVDEQDTHGGFHGDGWYYLILDCSSNKEKALDNISTWKELPLTENLELIMYGGEKDGVHYGSGLSEKAKMPKIENGYYSFNDRNLKAINKKDDAKLLDRYSFNFSLAIYDVDTDIMYYFEYDT